MTAITLNGEPREVPPGSSLADLVAAIADSPQALATAVNGEFVAREARGACLLRDGDAVFTFQPITGG
jgi:sulfur carrier protein